jgi:hypothetical protein
MDRLVVIERVQKRQALVEEFLSFWVSSGNRMMVVAQAFDQPSWHFGGLGHFVVIGGTSLMDWQSQHARPADANE